MAINLEVTTRTVQVAVITLGEDEATALREAIQNVPKNDGSTIHDDVIEKLYNNLRAEGF